jgi:hypothetical protein
VVLMAAWTLAPCLVSLRTEINQLAPNRDKASDGSIGDAAHQAAGTSDHLPDGRGLVHAIDVDNTGPWPAGWSMAKIVQTLVTRSRSGAEDRIQNVIYMRTIYSRSWGWTARAYTGPNPHDHHMHVSARYGAATENDTRPWGLLDTRANAPEEFVMATKDEVKVALREVLEETRPFTQSGPRKRLQTDKPVGQKWSDLSLRGLLEYVFDDAVKPDTDDSDEAAIVSGVLAGLNPQQIAAAVVAAMPADQARRTADEIAARLAA